MKRSRAISTQNSKGVEFLFKKNKITWIKGQGTLVSPTTVSVTLADGKQETHEAKRGIVISTGSRVKGLPAAGLPLDRKTVLSSDDVLVLERAPKSMAVVGCGAVGCEFGDVFASYGTQVTMIEIAPSMLPLEDGDVAAELARSFKKRKIDVLTNAKVRDVQIRPEGVSMKVDAGGQEQSLTVEQVLVAAGRAPNVDGIGLEKLGVKLTDRGFIQIDDHMKTSVAGVYAIGDVAGPPMLAHKGQREGVVVAETLAGLHPHLVNYGNIPNATYCHPEVALIGLTEAQCKERQLAYKVGRFPFSANGRARTAGETEGFVKIIRRRQVRGDPGRAHHRLPRDGDHPRAGRRAGERVHGRGGRPRHPRPPDALRGDRGGDARLDGADGSCLSSGSPTSARCRTARRWSSSVRSRAIASAV